MSFVKPCKALQLKVRLKINKHEPDKYGGKKKLFKSSFPLIVQLIHGYFGNISLNLKRPKHVITDI